MKHFDLPAHRSRVTPEHPALEDLESGLRYNYRQLNEQAARFAAAATGRWGLKPGDRVAWLATAARNSLSCCSAAPRQS